MNPAHNQEQFNRQRRNLTLAWAVLFFYQTTEPMFDRFQLGSAGFSLVLGKPEYVPLWLWGIMIYFLIRYYQYFNAHHPLASDRDLIGRQVGLAENAANRSFRDNILKQNPNIQDSSLVITLNNSSPAHQKYWEWNCPAYLVMTDGKGEKTEIPTLTYRVEGFYRAYLKFKGFLLTSWERPYFTEYWLPFLLPFISIAWAISNKLE